MLDVEYNMQFLNFSVLERCNTYLQIAFQFKSYCFVF